MKRSWYLILAVVTVLAAGSYGYWKRVMPSIAPHMADRSPSNEQIEALQAVPYAQWSRNRADPAHSGVTQYDRDAADPGYNLYTNDLDEIYLLDMSGKHRHTWKVQDGRHCEYSVLFDNGDLLSVCEGQAVVKMDWNSNLIWREKLRVHHDIEILADGSILTLVRDMPVIYNSRKVIFDSIVHLSASGETLDAWSTFENVEKLKRFHEPSPLDVPPAKAPEQRTAYDYFHLNTIRLLPETALGRQDRRFHAGNLLICSRNTSMIAILDRTTGDVVWSFGSTVLDKPHFPVFLKTGNLLIFDNGTARKFSRILEIEPVSGKIVWEYKGSPASSFFSPWQGSAQRLKNGNTLICESDRGHVFEVNPKGMIVWEFWNPVVEKGKRKTIYRFLRLPTEMVESLLTNQ